MTNAKQLYKEETGHNPLAYDMDSHSWFETQAYISWLEDKVESLTEY